MKYQIQNVEIDLELNDKVFQPSPHGSQAIGGNIVINPDETVFDLGSGTGLLSIFAAKKGGIVSATDVLEEAIELTKANVSKNGVKVDVQKGDLFEPFVGQKFDVIIANVPQELLSPKIRKSFSPEIVTGMHGGDRGNDVLMRALKESPKFMHNTSRLYVAVYSMSDARQSLRYISDNFSTKLINFYSGPVKDFVYDDLEWYEKESEDGLVSIYQPMSKR